MKYLKTNSDIGSVLIGNQDWTFAVPNIGGDGITDVFILDESEKVHREHSEYKERCYILDNQNKKRYIKYISSAYGNFGIFRNDVDYSYTDELKKPIIKLEGKYQIYQGDWCVIFSKKGE